MYNKYKHLIPDNVSERAIVQKNNYLESLPREIQEEITNKVNTSVIRTVNKSLHDINNERFCNNFKFIHNSQGILANYNSEDPFVVIEEQKNYYTKIYNASIKILLIDAL